MSNPFRTIGDKHSPKASPSNLWLDYMNLGGDDQFSFNCSSLPDARGPIRRRPATSHFAATQRLFCFSSLGSISFISSVPTWVNYYIAELASQIWIGKNEGEIQGYHMREGEESNERRGTIDSMFTQKWKVYPSLHCRLFRTPIALIHRWLVQRRFLLESHNYRYYA